MREALKSQHYANVPVCIYGYYILIFWILRAFHLQVYLIKKVC